MLRDDNSMTSCEYRETKPGAVDSRLSALQHYKYMRKALEGSCHHSGSSSAYHLNIAASSQPLSVYYSSLILLHIHAIMSGNNDQQASTLGSMLQSAVGTVQSGLGQLTGSGKDINAGETKKVAAEDQNEKSHATAKLGPVTATGEGGAHVDNKDRQQGTWDQTVGSGKQFVGGIIGNESLKSQGRTQYDEGVRKEASGQASDLVEGLSNRVGGTIGAMVSTDRNEQEEYRRQHDEGKAAVRSVQYDLQKKAEAEQRSQ
ncbi:hypothetical protein Dda_7763 [Drechslerella dactyloides]|uniref:CsbD-like domain-containing protein n=1 Tax=Drechslerella dactyloides TaxID=74499 RepID=A0AAD6ISS7_DREDA|nr:hypothetical protein Dda_7763 [Drechslerella dactyloides]